MKPAPYIGITGPVTIDETRAICDEFSRADYTMNSAHVPMLGFLVSYKTLNGQTTNNRRYPSPDALSTFLRLSENKVLPMIHYYSKKTNTLSKQVTKLFDGLYETGLCDAIQLNIVWPSIKQVSKIKEQHPDMKIVFQASQKAMAGQTPSKMAKGVKAYGDALSYVLIDPSGGRGLPFDIDSSIAVYSELINSCPDLCIGFAGGFTGENVTSQLTQIIDKIGVSDFCIDAEGGLRDKLSSEYGDDLLNLQKVKHYLQSTSKVLK